MKPAELNHMIIIAEIRWIPPRPPIHPQDFPPVSNETSRSLANDPVGSSGDPPAFVNTFRVKTSRSLRDTKS